MAKGIRRIVAVTGDEANNLFAEAQSYEQRIKKLSKLGHNALGNELKVLGKDLDQATLPLVQKAHLRAEFAKIKTDFLNADKQIKLNEVNQVLLLIGC